MKKFDYTPVLYEKDTRNVVEDFIFDNFRRTDDAMVYHDDASAYVHSDIYNFGSGLLDDCQIYVTCGMGARVQNSLLLEYERMELVIFCSKDIKNDMDIINMLYCLTKLPFFDNTYLAPYHTIDATEKIKKRFGYSAFLFLPKMFECAISDGSIVKFLPLLPLYSEELDVIMRYDDESIALKKMLVERAVNNEFTLKIDEKRENLAKYFEQGI